MALTRINNNSLSSVTAAGIPIREGSVIQVRQSVRSTTPYTSVETTWTDIPDLSVNITPTSSSSKFLVSWDFYVGTDATRPDILFKVVRDTTAIYVGDNDGGTDYISHQVSNSGDVYMDHQQWAQTGQYLDTPNKATSITYKIQGRNLVSSSNWKIGARWANNSFQQPAQITVIEIAGA
jgi:hypothetical protein